MEILVFAHGLGKELNGPPSRPGTRFMTVYLADCQVVIKMLLNWINLSCLSSLHGMRPLFSFYRKKQYTSHGSI